MIETVAKKSDTASLLAPFVADVAKEEDAKALADRHQPAAATGRIRLELPARAESF